MNGTSHPLTHAARVGLGAAGDTTTSTPWTSDKKLTTSARVGGVFAGGGVGYAVARKKYPIAGIIVGALAGGILSELAITLSTPKDQVAA
jgi:hypothetical protein